MGFIEMLDSKFESAPSWEFVVVPRDQKIVFGIEEPLLVVIENIVEWDNGDTWAGPFAADEIETIVAGSYINEDTGEATSVCGGVRIKKLRDALK
jgi:hypothetical protein